MHAVAHEPGRTRFVIAIEGAEAVLSYRMLTSSVVDFHHTWTPAELRGRGLAALLVAAGVAWARAQGHTIIPSCSYVAAWLERSYAGDGALSAPRAESPRTRHR
jgi:predicted GNAT family acetyltransferase